MVVGAMTVSMVNLNFILDVDVDVDVDVKKSPVLLQGIFDSIMLGLMPLLFTVGLYYLLGKGIKPLTIIAGIAVLGLFGSLFHILG